MRTFPTSPQLGPPLGPGGYFPSGTMWPRTVGATVSGSLPPLWKQDHNIANSILNLGRTLSACFSPGTMKQEQPDRGRLARPLTPLAQGFSHQNVLLAFILLHSGCSRQLLAVPALLDRHQLQSTGPGPYVPPPPPGLLASPPPTAPAATHALL